MQNPVIVIPGITASELRDEYQVQPENVWSAVVNHDYERITLHPDDVRYERDEPARIRADAVFNLPYGELIAELRHNLTERADKSVPVYPFPYDWRLPLSQTVEQLHAFIEEVIDRTKLIRHYDRDGYGNDPHVDLVGHSMGGLVIGGYLVAHGSAKRIGKIATLGTPFGGSYEAPIKVLTGTASLGAIESGSREREASRITPALYHLVPRFKTQLGSGPQHAVVDQAGAPVDMFKAANWQRGVLESLAEFIRMHAVNPPRSQRDRLARAEVLLQQMLSDADDYRTAVDKLSLSASRNGLQKSSWLCIAGADEDTRIRLRLEGGRFSLRSADRDNFWSESTDRILTGDGTVPLGAAVPDFLEPRNVVCVVPGDLGYWEIGDRALRGAVGFHGLLPKVNLVQRLVIAHLRGKSGRRNSDIWGQPMPSVSSSNWSPAISHLRIK